jgi:hypothetical protein
VLLKIQLEKHPILSLTALQTRWLGNSSTCYCWVKLLWWCKLIFKLFKHTWNNNFWCNKSEREQFAVIKLLWWGQKWEKSLAKLSGQLVNLWVKLKFHFSPFQNSFSPPLSYFIMKSVNFLFCRVGMHNTKDVKFNFCQLRNFSS